MPNQRSATRAVCYKYNITIYYNIIQHSQAAPVKDTSPVFSHVFDVFLISTAKAGTWLNLVHANKPHVFASELVIQWHTCEHAGGRTIKVRR